MGSGQATVKKDNEYLRDLIINGGPSPVRLPAIVFRSIRRPKHMGNSTAGLDGHTKLVMRFGNEKAA